MSLQKRIPAPPPRPPNAFICFRSRFIRDKKAASHAGGKGGKGSMMCDVSRQAGDRWNDMSDEEQRPYFDLALRMREAHNIAYPNYKFCPSKRGGRTRRPRSTRRRAQATTSGAVEVDTSFTSDSFDDASHPMPTLSSPSTPSDDKLYRSHESPQYFFADLSGAQNEDPQFSYPRSDRPDSWDKNLDQFGIPPAPDDSKDPAVLYGRSETLSPKCQEPDDGFEPIAKLFEPPQDFGSFCQWDNDFSESHTAGSKSSVEYRLY
ncbi:HMG box domain-containing protein [Mycena venus]|uniref:HMG box domain-containing protein n=1 Tax=Mycena venus TaxID=2733690 RepID=A0A8H6X745_9AGAR|nr:HMG box domain-containing protein [Mycena venus]